MNTAKEAVKVLSAYTAGRNDIWMLAGDARARCRAHVMSILLGKKTPQSKAGVTAIRSEFYRQAGISGECGAEREENFWQWAKTTLAEN